MLVLAVFLAFYIIDHHLLRLSSYHLLQFVSEFSQFDDIFFGELLILVDELLVLHVGVELLNGVVNGL